MSEAPKETHAAFAELYSRSHLPLLRYVMTMLPNRAMAEDIVQETAKNLWEKFDQYDPNQPFLPWARKFAYFETLNQRRKLAVRRKYFCSELVETLADEREQLDPALEQQREALGECLAKLDGPARELLLERYAKERSLTDVAASMGRSRNSLYVMMHRIRQKLAECVSRQIGSEGLPS